MLVLQRLSDHIAHHRGHLIAFVGQLRAGSVVEWLFTFAAAVYNLVRMRNLVEAVT